MIQVHDGFFCPEVWQGRIQEHGGARPFFSSEKKYVYKSKFEKWIMFVSLLDKLYVVCYKKMRPDLSRMAVEDALSEIFTIKLLCIFMI